MDVWITIGGKIKSNVKIRNSRNGQECPFHTVESAEPEDGGNDDGDEEESAQDVLVGGEPGFGWRRGQKQCGGIGKRGFGWRVRIRCG